MDITTRTKIDAIWQGMWDNGMADAKTNITQITYLLFIKMLDDAQLKKEANANAFGIKVKNPTFKEGIYIQNDEITITYEDLRWHNFVHYSTEKMFTIVKDYVFKFIREMHNGENNAFARFMTDAKLDIPSGKILEKVIRGLDDNELSLDNKEIMGDVYEYLLAKLSVNGTNGQFRTPRHIISMMVNLMQPKLGEVICDPAMGSAGFLMESAKYIHAHQKSELNDTENRRKFNSEMFYGNETDPDMLRIGTMNMTLHDVSDPQIFYKNSLTDDNKDEYKYDLILAVLYILPVILGFIIIYNLKNPSDQEMEKAGAYIEKLYKQPVSNVVIYNTDMAVRVIESPEKVKQGFKITGVIPFRQVTGFRVAGDTLYVSGPEEYSGVICQLWVSPGVKVDTLNAPKVCISKSKVKDNITDYGL